MAKNIKKKSCKKVETKDPIDQSINGWLLEIASDKDGFNEYLNGQVYMTTINSGVKKGYHIHIGADYFVTCIRGRIKSTIYLNKDQKKEFYSGDDDFKTYRLPLGSAHLMENVGDNQAYVIIYRYPSWSPDFKEQLDIEPDDIETDKAWKKIKKFVKAFQKNG